MTRSSLLVLGFALAFAAAVLAAARRHRTDERHTLGWLFVCAALAALAIWRPAIDLLARAMGIYYAPSALFFLCLAALLVIVFRLSLGLARQQEQLRTLAQELALLSATRPGVTQPVEEGRQNASSR
ncbi:MAG: DUF2304 domain-containing protein [Deltaproteobacteria bacterium]